MKNIDKINDYFAISELKARYCRLMDSKDWAGYRELFTEDYELDVAQAGGVELIRGRDDALQMVLSHIEHAVTVHQVHSPEIQIDGDRATGIWAMQDRVVFADGPKITGYGHYTDRYECRNGEWLISASKLTRLHIDVDPST
jgi:hypothetical protein